MTASFPTSLPGRLRAIARTLRLPPAETPPDVTGHWYRQAADAIDEAIAELEPLLADDAARDLPNPLVDTRLAASPAPNRPDLDALVEEATIAAIDAEAAAQHLSWVRGEMRRALNPEAENG